MTPRLTEEQRQAVDAHQGFLEVEGGDGKYIVMSIQVFRDMMGVGTDEDYQASLQAIEEGLTDIEAGRMRPMAQVFRELDDKHGVHG